MKLLNQPMLLMTLASLAVCTITPHKQEGVYHYDHQDKTHTKVGSISRAGSVKVPKPPATAAEPVSNSRKLARSLMLLDDMDDFYLDFDILARGFLDDEDMLEDFYIRDAGPGIPSQGKSGRLLSGAPPQGRIDAEANQASPETHTTGASLTGNSGSTGHMAAMAPGMAVAATARKAGTTKNEVFPANKATCRQEIVTAEDFAAAYESLAIACRNGAPVNRRTSMYAVSGQAMVYMCNYARWFGTQTCKASEMWDAFTTIQKKCPDYRIGWAFDESGYKSYGLEIAGKSICGF